MGDRRTKTVPPEIQELLDQGLFAAAVRDGNDILSELDYGSVELAQECLEGLTVYCSEFTGFVKKRIAPSVELREQLLIERKETMCKKSNLKQCSAA